MFMLSEQISWDNAQVLQCTSSSMPPHCVLKSSYLKISCVHFHGLCERQCVWPWSAAKLRLVFVHCQNTLSVGLSRRWVSLLLFLCTPGRKKNCKNRSLWSGSCSVSSVLSNKTFFVSLIPSTWVSIRRPHLTEHHKTFWAGSEV